MFDAKGAFKGIQGNYSLGQLQTKLSQVRQTHLEHLAPETSSERLLEYGRSQKWILEQDGKFTVRVKD